MKFLTVLSLSLLVACSLASCNSKNESKGGSAADSLKPGERAVYNDNGKLRYIVESKDGKSNGRVREYTSDGKLYMDAIYKDDHRNGKCTFYYKSGKPFSVCYYINGAKDSIDTKYSEDGRILALVPYKNDKVQPGLKEFEKDGSERIETAKLQISAINNLSKGGKYYLSVNLSEPRKNVKFYASPQSDPDSRELLKMSGKNAILEVPVSSVGFVVKNIFIEAEYKTAMGNTRRLQKLHKF